MNSIKVTLAALGSSALLMFASQAAYSQEVVLKALTFSPPAKIEDSMNMFRLWIDKVNAAGKGRVKIEIMGGPEVFPVNDQVNAVSKGLADIVMSFTAHASAVPEVNSLGFSQLTPTEEREVGYFQLMDEAHNKINIKLIGRTATNAGFHIYSKELIDELDDFKGLTIRSHSGYDPFFKALGANTIGIAISEIYGALERGIVEAAPYPIYVYELGVQEVVKYALEDKFWTSHTTTTMMNLEKFNSLPDDVQKILTDAQLELESEMPALLAELEAVEKKRLVDSGLIFTSLSPEEHDEYIRLSITSRYASLVHDVGEEKAAQIRSMIFPNF